MSPTEDPQTATPAAQARLASALSHFQALRYDSALQELSAVLARQPNLAEALCLHGKVLVARGLIEKGISAFEDAIRANPEYAPAHLGLAHVFREAGRFEEARAACRRALAIQPEEWVGQMLLGLICDSLGQDDESFEAYSEVIRINPEASAAYYKIARIQLDRNDDRGAISTCRSALRRDLSNASARMALGDFHNSLQEHEEAVEQYQVAAKLSPELREANLRAGAILEMQGSQVRALAEYNQALAISSGAQKVACLERIAAIHISLDRPDKALAAYMEALALTPQRSDLYDKLQGVFETLGRHDDAMDARRKGSELEEINQRMETQSRMRLSSIRPPQPQATARRTPRGLH